MVERPAHTCVISVATRIMYARRVWRARFSRRRARRRVLRARPASSRCRARRCAPSVLLVSRTSLRVCVLVPVVDAAANFVRRPIFQRGDRHRSRLRAGAGRLYCSSGARRDRHRCLRTGLLQSRTGTHRLQSKSSSDRWFWFLCIFHLLNFESCASSGATRARSAT